MNEINRRIVAEAEAELGTAEWAKGSNPEVVKYYAEAGHKEVKDDSVPWCAAFVGSVLARAGVKGSGSLMARSYTKWGTEVVGLADAMEGDVVILSRGTNPVYGHVAFFKRHADGKVYLLGGNQGDVVKVSAYPVSRIVAIRRAPEPRTSLSQSSTVQASAVQIASGAGAGLAAVGSLDGDAQIVALVFVGVVILAALWVMRERLRKWAEGDR